jgi:flagellin-like hook-associated protein FlgL
MKYVIVLFIMFANHTLIAQEVVNLWAESNISDADTATEVAKSASYHVQVEIGVAVQSQMHAINKTVLQLLG